MLVKRAKSWPDRSITNRIKVALVKYCFRFENPNELTHIRYNSLVFELRKKVACVFVPLRVCIDLRFIALWSTLLVNVPLMT